MKRLHPAEKLSDVLDLLSVRHCSGLLSVERFARGRFEEGEIYFEKGRPVYARHNQKSGEEAFARLKDWRQIYFAFDKNALCPVPRTIPPSSLLPTAESARLPQPSFPGIPRDDNLPGLRATLDLPLSNANVEQLVPHRSEVRLNVLSLPLTRAQRAVYLLVDGKRTIVDLARCIGKSIHTVVKVLDELLRLGLILI
jgi:hypothetical protein